MYNKILRVSLSQHDWKIPTQVLKHTPYLQLTVKVHGSRIVFVILSISKYKICRKEMYVNYFIINYL